MNIFNRVVLWAVILALAFILAANAFELGLLIVTLNGVFWGTMAAVAVAYGNLLYNAVRGLKPYDRVRQMTIGFALCWVAYGLSVYTSTYFRASDIPVTNSLMTAASRYIAVVAAVMQVTAPDFGLGLFHGRERRVLWSGGTIGLAVALFIIYAQQSNILAGFISTEAYADGQAEPSEHHPDKRETIPPLRLY